MTTETLNQLINNSAVRERRFLEVADKVAYIPFLGTGIGLLRIIGAIATAILMCPLLYLFGVSQETRNYTHQRVMDEAVRGAIELVPFLSLSFDHEREDAEKDSVITSLHGAYGRYVYKSPWASCAYSKEGTHYTNVEWQKADGYSFISAIFGNPPEPAAESDWLEQLLNQDTCKVA
ncbi:MAG: hypothetical protein KGJ02_08295 [Verrucomicrobiota bacterium]|nr:hypothetical protein [Verrucomicrobiota bacterium]